MKYPTIPSLQALCAYVEEVGLLPLFAGGPAGFSVYEMTAEADWWSGDPARDPWEWRYEIAAEGRIAYGKFFGGKAGLVSKACFPDFANYRRDGYDFDARWEDGKADRRDKLIWEQLPGDTELASYELKKRSGVTKGFDGALTRLQMRAYLVVRGATYKQNKLGEYYGWPASAFSTAEALFGEDYVTSQYKTTPECSRQRLLHRLRTCCSGLPVAELERFILPAAC